ncbi:MAG: sterol desaturase family protein, partial [Pirellulales bacterium]
MRIAIEFVAIFGFIAVLGYFVPAGYFYYLYYVRDDESRQQRRVQQRRPTAAGIRREIKLSLQSVLIFSIMATVLFQLYKAGQTGIYWRFREYPLVWLPVSFVLCLVIHDMYFYWTHRFMHLPRVFKYFHLGHHKSISPTPWAIYAFQPAEAFLQFSSIFLIIVFVPLHLLVLALFLWYDTLVNVAGHTGYEMVPKWASRSWFYKGFNTVTHHDTHHTNMKVNLGAFFNVWDRLMGTFQDDV